MGSGVLGHASLEKICLSSSSSNISVCRSARVTSEVFYLVRAFFSLVYIGVLVLWRIVNQIEKSSKVCYLTLFAVDWWKWAVLISLQCSTLYTNGKWRNDYCHWWYIEIYWNSAIRHAIDHNYDWVVFVSVSLTAFGHWVVNLNWSSGGSYVYAHSCSHQRPYWEWMGASNWHAIFVISDTLVLH